jgi:ribosomal-protein-alanine N-acetyltransferase
MRLTIAPLRWRDARAIARWHYPEPYAIYDMRMLVPMLIETTLSLFGAHLYYHALNERGELIGFFSLVNWNDEVEVGLALRPDLTGQGLGLDFLLAGLAYATKTFHPVRFRLDVATFNQRALRVYERANFQPVRTFTRTIGRQQVECVEMIRDA